MSSLKQNRFIVIIAFVFVRICTAQAQSDTLFSPIGRDMLDTIPKTAAFFEFWVNDKWGVMHRNKNVVIPPTNEQRLEIQDIRAGDAPIFGGFYRLNNKLGFINLTTGVHIPPLYDEIKLFGIGTSSLPNPSAAVTVVQNGRYGLLHKATGKTWLPCQYDAIKQLCASFLVQKNKKWGLFHEIEGELLAIEYDKIDRFYGTWVFRKGKKWGYLRNELYDGKVQKKSEMVYDSIENVNYLMVWRGKKRAFVNLDYTETPFDYSYFKPTNPIFRCGESLTACFESTHKLITFPRVVKKGRKFGLINEKGEVVTPFRYDTIQQYSSFDTPSDAVNLAKRNKKWGLLDSKGQVVVPIEYEDYETESNKKMNIDFCFRKRENWLYFATKTH